jgi:DNA-binding NarL/FixJ family response regulator
VPHRDRIRSRRRRATREVVAGPQSSDVRVLVLTTFDEDDHVFEAIRTGAAGRLLEDVFPTDLREGICVVAYC